MNRFEDKTVIITGASGGLGHGVAIRLAKEGANLVLVGRNMDKLNKCKEDTDKFGQGRSIIFQADVTDEAKVKEMVDKTIEEFGQIDGFFNNSGVEGKQDLTEDYGSDEFKWVLDVNLNGVFYGMKYVLEKMHENKSGKIVNCASVGGIRGVGNQSGYSASKHGVVGLTRNSAREYGQYGININAIAPGAIMTEMVEKSLKQMGGDDWQEAGKEFVSVNPMKRFGEVEEVAGVVAFLLSDDANFVNGQVLAIDGGQSSQY